MLSNINAQRTLDKQCMKKGGEMQPCYNFLRHIKLYQNYNSIRFAMYSFSDTSSQMRLTFHNIHIYIQI